MAWEASMVSSSELFLEDFTPVTMPMTAPTSRMVAKRDMKSFLFFLFVDNFLPDSDILAKNSLMLAIFETGYRKWEERKWVQNLEHGGQERGLIWLGMEDMGVLYIKSNPAQLFTSYLQIIIYLLIFK